MEIGYGRAMSTSARSRCRLWLLLALALCLPSTARAGESLPVTTVEPLESGLRAARFSGELGVERAGQPLYHLSASGAGTGEPLPAGSVFWIGSLSKQFAAVAALRLVDRGVLRLDEPLTSPLGLPAGALQRDGATCTLAHVLHHTCGLPGGNPCGVRAVDTPAAQRRLLACVADLPLRSKPGAAYAYSNLGYDLVGAVVARKAGVAYEAFLRRELFEPLGMTASGVDLTARPELLARLAQGEASWGLGWVPTWPWLLLDPGGPGRMGASGNLYSTVGDLHRFNRGLHEGELLTPASYQRLITPALEGYGLGVGVEDHPTAGHWIWHNGSLTPMGWSAYLAYLPASHTSVVGLANRGHRTSRVLDASRALVAAALGDEPPEPLLRPPGWKGHGVELLGFLVPLLLVSGLVGVLVALLRGPRGRALVWLGSVLTSAAVFLFGATLFDLFGRARYLSPPLLALVAVAVVVWRAQLVAGLLPDCRDPKRRNSALGSGVAVLALVYASEPAGRTWMGALLGLVGLLVGALVARSVRRRRQRPVSPAGSATQPPGAP